MVVDFKESTLSESLIPGCPTIYIHVPAVNDMRERKCCTICTIPLRGCKAITIYKIQGLTVGPRKVWEHVIVWLPTERQRKKHLGLNWWLFQEELVLMLWLSEIERLSLLKLGKGKACNQRRNFEATLIAKANTTHEHFIQKITQLDPSATKSFDRGCAFLLQWYRSLQ